MKQQHTLTPWELRQSVNGYWFIDHEQGGESYTLTKLECGEDDARLIAAAPELLVALEACLHRLDAHDDQSAPECLAARAAIARATGEAK